MQTLDKAWQHWISENFTRGCTHEAMLADMLKAGGATVLPDINLSVYLQKGSALYFSYVNSKRQVDPSTLHGGSPVAEGEKWIATKWIREHVYS